MMRKSRQIVFGNGKNYRSISHVDNTIDAFLKVENAPESIGKFYWIGDEKADYTVDEIYSTFCEAFGNRYRPLYIPAFVCSGMRLVDTLLGRSGALNPTVHGISKFDFDIAGRVDAAKRDFHYQPKISLREYARELALST
jgi:nucleoside-diphosphate-sugar epimerase